MAEESDIKRAERAEMRKLVVVQVLTTFSALVLALFSAWFSAKLTRDNEKIAKRRELRQQSYARLTGLVPQFAWEMGVWKRSRLDLDLVEVRFNLFHREQDRQLHGELTKDWLRIGEQLFQVRRDTLEALGH